MKYTPNVNLQCPDQDSDILHTNYLFCGNMEKIDAYLGQWSGRSARINMSNYHWEVFDDVAKEWVDTGLSISLIDRGVWNATTTYTLLDFVRYNGSSYVYLNAEPSAGHLLTEETYWNYLAQKGDKGDAAYNPTVTVKTNTDTEFVLTVSDNNGSYDTPNLKGFTPSIDVKTDTVTDYKLTITGEKGAVDTPNLKGYSPTVAVKKQTDTEYVLEVIDKDGVKTTPNLQGQDGFTPTVVEKTKSATEYVLTITNENGSVDTPNLQGQNGFTPVISEKSKTDTEYVLTITNENGSIDTPNLQGKDAVSPVIAVKTDTENEYVLDITDKNGLKTTPNLKAFTPKIEVKENTATNYTLEITDVSGTKTTPNLQGQDGFTPVVTVKKQTPDEYILTITGKDGVIDTPNLKGQDGQGSGDMLKSSYDSNNDGIVNNSDALQGHPASYFVAAEAGKGLSANDYTTAEKSKLAGLSNYDDTQIKADITSANTAIGQLQTRVESVDNSKVDKVTGKGLSTNDYTTTEKNKLAGLSKVNLINNDGTTLETNLNVSVISTDEYLDYQHCGEDTISYLRDGTVVVDPETSFEINSSGEITAYIGPSGLGWATIPSIVNNTIVKRIGNDVYNADTSTAGKVQMVMLPNTITEIGSNAFKKCEVLFPLPPSIKRIEDYAFYGNRADDEVIKHLKNLEYIGAYAFANNNIRRLTIPNNIKHIGDNAFYECGLLEVVWENPSEKAIVGSNIFAHNKLYAYLFPMLIKTRKVSVLKTLLKDLPNDDDYKKAAIVPFDSEYISFYVDGEIYTGASYINFEEYVNSALNGFYNKPKLTIVDTDVKVGNYFVAKGTTKVTKNTILESDCQYSLIS